jgi:molybdenum cofactor cytidylyltransferase
VLTPAAPLHLIPNTAAVLLAAGESKRMGSPKPLLPWFGATLVERQTEALLTAGVETVCIVTGHRRAEVADAAAKSPTVHTAVLKGGRRVVMAPNARYREGKTTSIRAGLAAIPPRARIIVILAVDQPRPANVIRRVIESHTASGRPITSPRYEGHGGHPLVFSASLLPELEAISEEHEGLREVMRRHSDEINWALFNHPVVRLDLNTPEAYQAALKTFAQPDA